ncbi:MAG: Gfo/Idh/MocA family oxidoreductase [Actinomycetota bacterium]
MEPLRIGFVGCGHIAMSHRNGLRSADGVEIGPVHDVDPERAHRFAIESGKSAHVVRDVGAVVEGSDAVYVCTWTAAHTEPVILAAEAGRAVFCEKPLAVDRAGAASLTRAVAAAGVVNQVGLVMRHSPAFRAMRHMIAEGRIGDPLNVVFRDDQYLPIHGLYRSTWRADVERAGAGTLLEHSIHDLDLLTWMLGPIESVAAQTANHHGHPGIEDVATVTLVAQSGAHATLTSVWHDVMSRPSQRRVEVFGRTGVLTLEGDWTGPVTLIDSSSPEPVLSLAGDRLVRVADAADGLSTNPDVAFAAAVQAGEPAYPDFATALVAHDLADAAYRSAADGGAPIEISADTGAPGGAPSD